MLVLAFFSHGWCLDNLVLVGQVTDSSKNNIPVQGIRVWVQGLTGGSGAGPITECKTDNLGNYKISYGGDYSFLHVYTSYYYAYQYTDLINPPIPASANRSDGKADTLTVNIHVGSVTPPPDTLVITGSVLVNPSKAPIKNATVKFYGSNPFILFHNTGAGMPTYDTLYTKTGDDGSFVFRDVNIYAAKSGSIIASSDSCLAATAGKGAATADTTTAHLFDGKTDSIICGIFYLKLKNPVRSLPAVTPIAGNSGTASVALYSLDGRLLKKIERVSLRNIDKSVVDHASPNCGVVLAVWSQNGTSYSKKISFTNSPTGEGR